MESVVRACRPADGGFRSRWSILRRSSCGRPAFSLPKPRRLDEPIAVSLEGPIPQGNFYRHLERSLDLSFFREWARELYAERGRPSIDPVVFFTLQLVIFFEGIRSERMLVETASLNLAHRWYLGYALDALAVFGEQCSRSSRVGTGPPAVVG
jgi:transposase